jgi:hypothetical protein
MRKKNDMQLERGKFRAAKEEALQQQSCIPWRIYWGRWFPHVVAAPPDSSSLSLLPPEDLKLGLYRVGNETTVGVEEVATRVAR